MAILMYVRKMMVLVPQILDVILHLLGNIVILVKLDITKLGVHVNHAVVILMENKVMGVTLMGNVIARLDTQETSVIPVRRYS